MAQAMNDEKQDSTERVHVIQMPKSVFNYIMDVADAECPKGFEAVGFSVSYISPDISCETTTGERGTDELRILYKSKQWIAKRRIPK